MLNRNYAPFAEKPHFYRTNAPVVNRTNAGVLTRYSFFIANLIYPIVFAIFMVYAVGDIQRLVDYGWIR